MIEEPCDMDCLSDILPEEMIDQTGGSSQRTVTTNEEDSISPPPRKRRKPGFESSGHGRRTRLEPELVQSPFSLNKIPNLPDDCNVDTVSLRDLIGDPLINECWFFDYLYDVDWVM